jgi:very-short-patch-repair endonuclease
VTEIDLGEELERFRERLLDLTTNNRLLNYRKSRRRTLQIVRELPDEIYDRLVTRGRAFRFLPKKDDTRKEPIQPDIIPAQEQPEADYELPQSNGDEEANARYRDNRLETDLEPDRLELVLKTIRRHARSAIEETGVNFLYLALGLLEWNEPRSNSTDCCQAPLLLIPIRVERIFDNRSGRYEYEITHNGEEVQDNLCLRKKLELDFGMSLERFRDEMTPEMYLEAIGNRISQRDGWTVRREALIGFFSFRKLLMYEDLDPAHWGEGLEANTILRSVFEGCQLDSGSPLFGVDYDIDEDETAQRILLVDNADSSQHSALCDIAKGRSLVIEGPPGTGKSQTITNAIAWALSQEKTVLFVSEKLAALDVVRRKLERLGLSDFCLELHSDAASPARVIEQLRNRLNKTYCEPDELERIGSALESRKAQLIEYLEACSGEHGPFGEALRDVFWRCVELRSRGIRPLRRVTMETGITSEQYERRKAALEELALHAAEIGPPCDHPWRWFWCPTIRSADIQEIIELVSAMAKCSDRLKEKAETLQTLVNANMQEWIQTCLRLGTGGLRALEGAGGRLRGDMCRLGLRDEPRAIIREVVERVKGYKHALGQVESCLVVPLMEAVEDSGALLSLKESRVVRCGGAIRIEELPSARSALSSLATILGKTISHAKYLEEAGYGKIRTLQHLHAAIERYTLIHSPAISSASQLSPEHFLLEAERNFVRAKKLREGLAQRQCELNEVFALIDVPSRKEVDEVRVALRQFIPVWLPALRAGYRQAKRRLMAFGGLKLPRKLIPVVGRLTELSEYLRDREKFANDGPLTRSLGPLFQGMDTNWERLSNTIRWAKTAKRLGISYEEAASELRERDTSTDLMDPILLQEACETLKTEREGPAAQVLFANSTFLTDDAPLNQWLLEVEEAIDILENLQRRSQSWRHGPDDTIASLLMWAHALDDVWREGKAIDNHTAASQLLGEYFSGTSTEVEALDRAVTWIECVESLALPEGALAWLVQDDPMARARELRSGIAALASVIGEWQGSLAQLAQFGEIRGVTLQSTGAGHPGESGIWRRMVDERDALMPWANYCRAAVRAEDLGLQELSQAVTDGGLPADAAADCYELMVFEGVAEAAVASSPALRSFSRQGLERVRESFRQLDSQLLELNRMEIASMASSLLPPEGNSTGRVGTYTELGLIYHEVRKQRRFCRIRSLIERAGESVQTLTPCFMMSPLSVAQFIPPRSVKFDLVLMDEASQIKPEDALGTLARAKQLVVVGDPKQLPPTSFFEKVAAVDVDEDQATIADETESILEVAMKAFPNARRLRWHYRSKHQSLIAFSNDRFYEGDLVAFPSPGTDEGRLGVFFHHVPNGEFLSGCNPVEASEVAQAIVRHALANPSETLGVGTFNAKQRSLVEDELDRICTAEPEARHAVEQLSENLEGLFIKNLENLQGDERDVIFIAYTYGPDPQSGRVANRFGPITHSTGWRRLNVLITRARKRVEVFSSMMPSDILGGPEKSIGVNAMKDYLDYCQTGTLGERGSSSGREPESPFEVAVARAVRKIGLRAVPQVGVAGYFIDLGVLKPGRDDEFLLGVECDGASYHSAKSARDRDRLREEVIRSRGWEIHRVWSTDWFQNQPAEEQRLRERIQSLL